MCNKAPLCVRYESRISRMQGLGGVLERCETGKAGNLVEWNILHV